MSREQEQRGAKPDALENQGQKAAGAPETSGEETPIYLSGNSTLQTAEEHERDGRKDPQEGGRVDVSNDDLHDVRLGRLTGRDENDSDKA